MVYKLRIEKKKKFHSKLYSALSIAAAMVSVVAFSAIPARALSPNLVVNGDFESGYNGFSSDYTKITTPGATALYDPGTYTVGSNPNDYHSSWSSISAHGGSGNMLIANGSEDSTQRVWYEYVTGLVPGHVYQLSAFVTSVYPSSPASLVFKFGNTTIGSGVNAGAVGDWQEFTGKVVVPAGVTSGDFAIYNDNGAYIGNDFAIDDISLMDVGSTVGKATGGIKFMAGPTSVQLDFVAMSNLENGAKGNVNYKADDGNWFKGKVTGYFQQDNVAVFVGKISQTNVVGWDYFYVAVKDNGEGSASTADQGVRVLAGGSAFTADMSQATGAFDGYAGNVQVHKQ